MCVIAVARAQGPVTHMDQPVKLCFTYIYITPWLVLLHLLIYKIMEYTFVGVQILSKEKEHPYEAKAPHSTAAEDGSESGGDKDNETNPCVVKGPAHTYRKCISTPY